MSVCWTDSKQTIEDLLVVMKDDASVTAGFVNFLWFIDSSWALRHSWKTYISLWIWRKQSLAVYRTCLMLLCTGFSVIISACFWKDSQTNPSQGPETLKLALQWGLNIFIITGRGSHQQRESLPLRSALWDWMSWMHRWVHSEIQTKTLHLHRLLIYKFIFSSAGCESHLHHLTVTVMVQSAQLQFHNRECFFSDWCLTPIPVASFKQLCFNRSCLLQNCLGCVSYPVSLHLLI